MDTNTHAKTIEVEDNNITNAKIATGNIFYRSFHITAF
jgi:hypothetical protein